MKILSICGIIAAQLLVHLADAQGCSNVVLRRDIMSLSQQEWNQMTYVLRRMNDDGWFRYFADIHNYEFGNIHGNDHFFPFHRRYLRDFEEVGQRYDRNFAVPFWDELRDSRNPAGSPVMSSARIGGNGFGACVSDGLQNGWTMSFPNPHCLSRLYDMGNQMHSWYSPEYIYSVMQRNNDMHGFRENIEFSLHGSVHLGIGGDMSTPYSSNDFAFFLHHANLDRLWDQWQSWGHADTIDGRDRFGNPLGLGSALPHYGDPIGSTMRLGTGRMCFRYVGGSSSRREQSALKLVSAPAASSADSADTNLARLPANLLQKWFPHVNHENGPLNGSNSTRSSLAPSAPSGKKMVYPAPLTDAWVSMHRFDRAKVDKAMQEAREFVDDLNTANYLSPY
ncbi:hypothetical protein LPJ53_000180 [Coemansia erecta]|uniref:Tyrosinase copper-binding domain-containing protein n=1 Tax=Coemansia erecta TaxID=147472 RepID=A0A9W7Y2H7_9FUNG|nr:hypothetical protein LPJ53_000180 [Coemansia erecta]